MSVSSAYRPQLHPVDCNCSVCWSHREMARPAPSLFTPCIECRRTKVFPVVTTMAFVWGKWRSMHSTYRVEPGFTCDKHMPARRPPQYWHVVYDSGKPTPFVPIREPFELEA